MKRFMKKCAITAAVLFLIGLFLAIVAGTARGSAAISEVVENVTGGRVHVNLGNIKNWGITIEDFDIMKSLDTVHYDINDSTMFSGDHRTYKDSVSKYCPGTEIEKLDIEVGGCILETKLSADNNLYIEVEKAYKFQGYAENGTLYIRASDGARTWSELGSCIITLYVPKEFMFESVDVEMGAGILKFADLRARDYASIEVGAGQIVIDSVQSNCLELEIGAGEIELKDMKIQGEFSVDVGMGNFEGRGVLMSDAEVECSMGNVKLELLDNEESFNYKIECAMGNISLGDNRYSGLAKEKVILNGAAKTMEIECAMGNVSVFFETETATH